MFIVTAKLNKKKVICVAVIAVALLFAAIILIGRLSRQSSGEESIPSLQAIVKNNKERVEYLEKLGWEVNEEPIETLEITIPREFPDVYKKYNEIQLQQGFDLSDYCGMKATRYTYKVLNYPSDDSEVVADIIVCENSIIAGNIQSTALNGFMHGLRAE